MLYSGQCWWLGSNTPNRALSVMLISVVVAGAAAVRSDPANPPALAEEPDVSKPPSLSPVMVGLPSVNSLRDDSGNWDAAKFVRQRVGNLIIMGGPERFHKLESMVIKITGACHGPVSKANVESTLDDLRLAFTDSRWDVSPRRELFYEVVESQHVMIPQAEPESNESCRSVLDAYMSARSTGVPADEARRLARESSARLYDQ